MKNLLKASLYTFIVGLTAAVLATGCSQSRGEADNGSPANKDGIIHIVAAENFYGQVAEHVGGDHVEVISLIDNPGADPHDYEPTPDAARKVAEGDLIIYNGIGYDNWMDNLVVSSSRSKKKTVIQVAEDVMGRENGDNEHVWYDPRTMPKLADALADALSRADAEHANDFRANAETFKQSLKPFADLVASLKQAKPVAVEATEPVFGYMLDALNLKVNNVKFAQAIEEGVDPSPSALGQMQDDLKQKKVKLLIKNKQAESPIVNQLAELARTNGIPVVEVTETMPAGKHYAEWMIDQLKQVEQALRP
jgi:zinc/manganese transport system substrate-binding protein